MDSLILANHVHCEKGERILDIGTGSGIIALILATNFPETRIIGIELQEALAKIAGDNVKFLSLEKSISILCRDVRSVLLSDIGGPVDTIVSNPPYIPHKTGRINPDPQKAIARHETTLTLEALVAAASRLLKFGGKFHVIYPIRRLIQLILKMKSYGIEPAELIFIHSKNQSNARWFIATGVKGHAKDIRVLPPVYLDDDFG